MLGTQRRSLGSGEAFLEKMARELRTAAWGGSSLMRREGKALGRRNSQAKLRGVQCLGGWGTSSSWVYLSIRRQRVEGKRLAKQAEAKPGRLCVPQAPRRHPSGGS